MIIAIDGPAGSGKSTVAKIVADKLNITYLDTGAIYRIITLYKLNNEKIDLDDINIDIKNNKFYLNNEDVTAKIRENEVANNVSLVASLEEVRTFATNFQREYASKFDAILDGRDIGTVVFPNAEVKVYLDASAEIRAKRRQLQNEEQNIESNYEEILQNVISRDEIDSNREIAPLKKAIDATEIKTDKYSINEVVEIIIGLVKNV